MERVKDGCLELGYEMLELDKVAGWKLTIMRSLKLESSLVTSNGNIACFGACMYLHVCILNLENFGKFVFLRIGREIGDVSEKIANKKA